MLPAPSDNIPHATANPALHTWHDQHMSVVFLMLGSSPSAVNAGRLGMHLSQQQPQTRLGGCID